MDPSAYPPHTICRIRNMTGASDVGRRLAQMGILPGVEVRIVQAAPLGGPILLQVAEGPTVALRREELETVECEGVAWPLTALSPSDTAYRVREIRGGRTVRGRLGRQGLAPGVDLRVMGDAPLRVRLEDSGEELTLGRGEAGRVVAQRTEEADHA
jgi:Fe2+ transport system protein FeoA